MIRLPCLQHLWHDVDDADAARIVAALTAEVGDALTESDGDRIHAGDEPLHHMPCPLEALRWAGDCEMYDEHVDQSMLVAGIIREDPEFGRAIVPWRDREPQRDGRTEAQRG